MPGDPLANVTDLFKSDNPEFDKAIDSTSAEVKKMVDGENAMKDTVSAVRTVLVKGETIPAFNPGTASITGENKLPTEVIPIKEMGSKAEALHAEMIALLGERLESDMPLNHKYWEVKERYRQAFAFGE